MTISELFLNFIVSLTAVINTLLFIGIGLALNSYSKAASVAAFGVLGGFLIPKRSRITASSILPSLTFGIKIPPVQLTRLFVLIPKPPSGRSSWEHFRYQTFKIQNYGKSKCGHV